MEPIHVDIHWHKTILSVLLGGYICHRRTVMDDVTDSCLAPVWVWSNDVSLLLRDNLWKICVKRHFIKHILGDVTDVPFVSPNGYLSRQWSHISLQWGNRCSHYRRDADQLSAPERKTSLLDYKTVGFDEADQEFTANYDNITQHGVCMDDNAYVQLDGAAIYLLDPHTLALWCGQL